jgi:hypothetical protein
MIWNLKIMDIITRLIKLINQDNLSNHLFHLAKELPCRTLNFTVEGHKKCTLYEADDFIHGSFPYADPNYHTVHDKPESVDLVNVKLATQLTLASVIHLDIHGN